MFPLFSTPSLIGNQVKKNIFQSLFRPSEDIVDLSKLDYEYDQKVLEMKLLLTSQTVLNLLFKNLHAILVIFYKGTKSVANALQM